MFIADLVYGINNLIIVTATWSLLTCEHVNFESGVQRFNEAKQIDATFLIFVTRKQ